VFALLERLGARQLDAADSLADLAPRLADRRRGYAGDARATS